MKQVVFVSGKGGTGKSTLVACLSILVDSKMLADCDVDAPNLHILIKGKTLLKKDYYGGKKAVINADSCNKCGLCLDTCLFDAINENMEIITMKCEGCGACVLTCPCNAIELKDVKTGQTYVVETKRGNFSHALLDMGAEGSGKLVTEVRKNVPKYHKNEEWLLIDGAPGIGCVVIASITGTDAVVAVSEPTLSGLKDLERVLGVARHFHIPAFVCINKYDLNLEITERIETYCREQGFKVIGKIPFDPSIVKALQEFKTPVEAGNEAVTKEILSIWNKLVKEMNTEKGGEKLCQEETEEVR